MIVHDEVIPRPEQFRDFLETEGPVLMVNLLKFKDRAEYADGRDAELPGREAYMRYAVEMRKLVEAAGGRFVFSSTVVGLLLGQVEELWHEVGIVEYPSAATLVEIATSAAYAKIDEHRSAGLAGQLNLTTTASEMK
jgi:uncharacterized protein (DUF1330 family)